MSTNEANDTEQLQARMPEAALCRLFIEFDDNFAEGATIQVIKCALCI